jgi:hypothetical protein
MFLSEPEKVPIWCRQHELLKLHAYSRWNFARLWQTQGNKKQWTTQKSGNSWDYIISSDPISETKLPSTWRTLYTNSQTTKQNGKMANFPDCITAFNTMKQALCSEPTVDYPRKKQAIFVNSWSIYRWWKNNWWNGSQLMSNRWTRKIKSNFPCQEAIG